MKTQINEIECMSWRFLTEVPRLNQCSSNDDPDWCIVPEIYWMKNGLILCVQWKLRIITISLGPGHFGCYIWHFVLAVVNKYMYCIQMLSEMLYKCKYLFKNFASHPILSLNLCALFESMKHYEIVLKGILGWWETIFKPTKLSFSARC